MNMAIRKRRCAVYTRKSSDEQFLYANVLVGLSLLLEDKRAKSAENRDDDTPVETIEERVDRTCRALAPFIPALVSLGSSDLETDEVLEGLEESA